MIVKHLFLDLKLLTLDMSNLLGSQKIKLIIFRLHEPNMAITALSFSKLLSERIWTMIHISSMNLPDEAFQQ